MFVIINNSNNDNDNDDDDDDDNNNKKNKTYIAPISAQPLIEQFGRRKLRFLLANLRRKWIFLKLKTLHTPQKSAEGQIVIAGSIMQRCSAL